MPHALGTLVHFLSHLLQLLHLLILLVQLIHFLLQLLHPIEIAALSGFLDLPADLIAGLSMRVNHLLQFLAHLLQLFGQLILILRAYITLFQFLPEILN